MDSSGSISYENNGETMKAGRDYIGVGVGAMVFNERGEVFLAQRGPHAKNERGCWEFPGGAVDFGEQLAAAVVREFAEEYAMTIVVERLLHVVDHVLAAEQQHWVSPTFVARHVGGTPRIMEPDKCTAIGWFTLDALPAPLSQATEDDVRVYVAHTSGAGVVGIDHIQLAMPQNGEEQARAFYVELLGLQEIAKPAPLAPRGGCWFEQSGAQIHLGVEEPFAPARKAHPALLVGNLDAWMARFEAAGIAITLDETVAGRRRFYVNDPFGNRIELLQNGDGFSQRSENTSDQ